MKRRALEKELKRLGWWLDGHGGNHDRWTDGIDVVPVPRHAEINEYTAKGILRDAVKGKDKNK